MPAGSSSSSGPTTIARVNGARTLPTLPGCCNHSSLEIEQIVPTSVAPYESLNTGPNHSIICCFTSTGQAAPVCEMLTMLLASFDEVDPLLEAALEGGADDAEVLAQLHRLNGGCAYSGVPGLQRLLSQLEQQLRDGVAVRDLEPELLELQDALEQVRQEAPRYLVLTD